VRACRFGALQATFFLPNLVASISQSAQDVANAAAAIVDQRAMPPPTTDQQPIQARAPAAIKRGLADALGFMLPMLHTLTLAHLPPHAWQAVAVDLPSVFTRQGGYWPDSLVGGKEAMIGQQ
jgi:hypothetical protein